MTQIAPQVNQTLTPAMENARAPKAPSRPAPVFATPINAHRRQGLDSTLYFMRTPSRPTWLKIGLAWDAERRLEEHRLSNPDAVFAATRSIPSLFDRQVERLMHARFGSVAQGREWFEVELADALKEATFLIRHARRAAARFYMAHGNLRDAA